MADRSATASATEEQSHGAEHTGFLHKLKEKLHIGLTHKEAKVGGEAEDPVHDAPVVSKSTTDDHVAKPAADVAAPTSTDAAPEEQQYYDARSSSTPDMASLAGHESEHHGGVPTFLAALPDQDVPAQDARAHPELHHVAESKEFQQGEHYGRVPEDAVPTFLAALPDQDIPAEDAPAHKELHHVEQVEHGAPHFDSKQGEHHIGVPTFLAALPDQDVPAQDTPSHPELHHVAPSEHQGELHGRVPEDAVPTFLAALPDQDIPAEDAPAHKELHHVEQGEHHHQGHGAPQFDSEQVFQDAQQGEHHHGVPTFLVALPDEEIPAEVTKGVESTQDSSAVH